VVFYSGENDIASGKSPDMTFDLFVRFADMMKLKVPETELIYLSIKPSIARWRMWEDMAKANDLIKRYIMEQDWIQYVDVASPMLSEDGKPLPEIFLGDDLHMNAKGYELWTKAVKPYLN
jgi:lysophospholipase L1-like esterase